MNKPTKLKLKRLYRGRKTSFWDKLTGRKHHRLSASVTGEGDWEVETPQIRMSRAFAVMLALHVIAVGGLFAYRIWGREEEPATGTDNAQVSTPDVTSETPSALPVPPPVSTPTAPAEVKTYIWRAGDSIQLIAASYGISTSALREANPDTPLVPGAEIIVPRAGRVFGGAEVAAPTGQPSPVFDPQAKLAAATPPVPPVSVAPRAVEVPEMPAHSEIPDIIPAPADEVIAVAQPVTSRTPEKGQPAGTKKTNDKTTVSVKPPAPAGTIAATTPKQPARTAGQSVHVVTKGDTVYNLARKYGYSAEEIAKLNGLGGDYRITLGQPLKIPVKR